MSTSTITGLLFYIGGFVTYILTIRDGEMLCFMVEKACRSTRQDIDNNLEGFVYE